MSVSYRYPGRSGIKVSPLTLGTMMFGGQADEATSRRVIDQAREQGINFIDTADVYNGGQSRKWIIQSVENNLRQLGTDYIDLVYLHRAVFDALLPLPPVPRNRRGPI